MVLIMNLKNVKRNISTMIYIVAAAIVITFLPYDIGMYLALIATILMVFVKTIRREYAKKEIQNRARKETVIIEQNIPRIPENLKKVDEWYEKVTLSLAQTKVHAEIDQIKWVSWFAVVLIGILFPMDQIVRLAYFLMALFLSEFIIRPFIRKKISGWGQELWKKIQQDRDPIFDLSERPTEEREDDLQPDANKTPSFSKKKIGVAAAVIIAIALVVVFVPPLFASNSGSQVIMTGPSGGTVSPFMDTHGLKVLNFGSEITAGSAYYGIWIENPTSKESLTYIKMEYTLNGKTQEKEFFTVRIPAHGKIHLGDVYGATNHESFSAKILEISPDKYGRLY